MDTANTAFGQRVRRPIATAFVLGATASVLPIDVAKGTFPSWAAFLLSAVALAYGTASWWMERNSA